MGSIFGLLNNRLFKPHRKADGPLDASAGSEQPQEAAMELSLRKLRRWRRRANTRDRLTANDCAAL